MEPKIQQKIHLNKNLPTANLDNEFAIQAKTDLSTAMEWLLFLYGVAKINPQKEDGSQLKFMIPLSEVKDVLKYNKKRSGDLYRQLRITMKKLAKTVCTFENDIEINGHKMPRYFTIFSEIGISNIDKKHFLEIEFNQKMKPILIGLKQNFLGIKPPVNVSSGHAINFLIYAKAIRDKRKKYDGKFTYINISVDDLKKRLNIVGKYKRIKDFKKNVIDKIQEGANKSGILRITDIEYKKTGRSITDIIFTIMDAETLEIGEEQPSLTINKKDKKVELEQLTYSEHKAYQFLSEKGVYDNIILYKILKNVPSSEIKGYEDYFCEEVYNIVVKQSKVKDKKGRTKILVDWFNKDFFTTKHFSEIIERLIERKKNLNAEVRDNREMAKSMTAAAFKKWYNKQ